MDAPAAWLTTEQMGLTALLLQSHQEVFHRSLLPNNGEEPSLRLRCQELFACGFPVLAHTNAADPLLSYANAAALQLWETHWAELIGMPSRLTAPPSERNERHQALGQAKQREAIEGYRGIRISRKGHRFMINTGRIWTLRDDENRPVGQAACFSDWWWLTPPRSRND